MASRYHARDRTVLKNSRDGLQEENLRTKEAVSISAKEKEMLLNASRRKMELAYGGNDTLTGNIREKQRTTFRDMDGNIHPEKRVDTAYIGEGISERIMPLSNDADRIDFSESNVGFAKSKPHEETGIHNAAENDRAIPNGRYERRMDDSPKAQSSEQIWSGGRKDVGEKASGNRVVFSDSDGVEPVIEYADKDSAIEKDAIVEGVGKPETVRAFYQKKRIRDQYYKYGANNHHHTKFPNEAAENRPAFREASSRREAYRVAPLEPGQAAINDPETDSTTDGKRRAPSNNCYDEADSISSVYTNEVDSGNVPLRDKQRMDGTPNRKDRAGYRDNPQYQHKTRNRNDEKKHKEKRKYSHSNKLFFSDEKEPEPKRKRGMAAIKSYAAGKAASALYSVLDYPDDKNYETDDIAGSLTGSGIAATRKASTRLERMKDQHFAASEGTGRLRFRRNSSRCSDEGQNGTAKDRQKSFQKKRYQRQYQQAKKQGRIFGRSATQGVGAKGTKQRVGGAAKKAMDVITGGKKSIAIAICLFVLIIIMVMSTFSGCVALMGGMATVLSTTYPGTDEEIRGVDAAYTQLEKKLDDQVNAMEEMHPGYDEYRYQVDEITHNPFQLASLLTAKFGDYTLADVEGELPVILNIQYTLSVTEEVEARTRTVTDPDTGEETEEEYDYYILNISLTNHGLDYVASQYLDDEQCGLYEAYCATKGNRKDLFDEDGITASPGGGAGGVHYDIPPEALSDERFRRMITEAEKYLGYPYVWGGGSPTTSFDCSGFVSWVINHSENGWNYGRRTAEGLRQLCTPVRSDDAKPGDLIFFQGTYATSGASHVGIYVGNGMMIHCGDPIQYASINTPYWQQHFYMFGRLP